MRGQLLVEMCGSLLGLVRWLERRDDLQQRMQRQLPDTVSGFVLVDAADRRLFGQV